MNTAIHSIRHEAGTRIRSTSITGLMILSLVSLLAGCAVDPLPQPPSMEAPMVRIESDGAGTVTINGEPGSTAPDALLTFINFNLDTSSFGLFTTTASRNGGFEIAMPGWRLNRYRVAVSAADGTTSSIDFHGNYDGSITVTALPLEECFTVSSLFEDFGDVAVGSQEFRAIDLTNSCGDLATIRITGIYLSDLSNFIIFHSTIGPEGIPIPNGETEQIGLYFSPSAEGEVLRTLVLGYTDGAGEYEARIVLRGQATPP